MSLRAGELAAVAAEVLAAARGRPVQKVVQRDSSTVILGLKGPWLLLSCDARLGRLHLADKPAGTGEAAPPFCMQLRKELTGLRLDDVAVVPGERAVEVRFSGPGLARALRLYLFGRASQLQLVEGERLLGAIGPAQRPHAGLPPPRPSPDEADRFGGAPDASARIAGHYREEAERGAAEQAAAEAERRRREAAQRLTRKRAALLGDRARAQAAADKRKLGDLLFAHLAEIPRGAAEVTLPDDFTDGSPLRIALDPARSAQENAQRFYHEHKRLTRALAGIDARLAQLDAELARLEAGVLPPPALAPRRRDDKRAVRQPPYKEFRSATGRSILVGRGADRNDELTFKVGRGNDLWLHARDVPGAHVIVPLDGRPVDEETLLDAATLAAHHSNARGEAQVDVGYTLRKNVRKPPRSRPGLVTTSELKTLRVRVEPERLGRLLGQNA